MFFIINIGSTRLDLAGESFDFLDLMWADKLFDMTQRHTGLQKFNTASIWPSHRCQWVDATKCQRRITP